MKNKRIRILALVLVLTTLIGTAAATATSTGSWLNQNSDSIVNIWDAQSILFGDRDKVEKQTFLNGIKAAVLGDSSVNVEFQTEGTGDSLVYLLSTPLDLYHLAAIDTSDMCFRLTADIDLEGASWTPISGFAGKWETGTNEDGDSYKIHNFTITESIADSNYPTNGDVNIGFFGDICAGATVENLHLEDFTIQIPETSEARFVGSVAGSVRGSLLGCTADGTIIDPRASCNNEEIYHGLICGRIPNTTTPGTVTLGEMTTVANETDAGVSVNAVMALELYGDADNETKFVGWQPGNTTVATGTWRDTSYGFNTLSKNEQDRRQTAVDYMYAQGSIQWTPSKTFAYVTNKGRDNATTQTDGSKHITHIHNNLYEAGRTYTGVPYNYNLGSLERFMTQVETDGTTGKYVQNNSVYQIQEVSDGLFNNYRTDADQSLSGFAQYMGNNCSGAIVLAWSRVAHSRHNFDWNSNLKYNGFRGINTYTMTPCTLTAGNISTATAAGVSESVAYNYSDYYGVAPVGWTPINSRDAWEIIDSMDGNDDLQGYGTYKDRTTTRTGSLSDADYQGMAECYSQANGGDVLAWSLYYENNKQTSDAHVRMIACDPVVIRDSSDGSIDLVNSYFLTHEQGDGLNDGRVNNGSYETGTHEYTDPLTGEKATYTFNIKPTSWRTNHKYTFELLLKGTLNGVAAAGSVKGCGPGYVPVTTPAFSFDAGTNYMNVAGDENANLYIDSAQVDAKYLLRYTNDSGNVVHYADGEIAPAQGSIYSHYKTVSSTLRITDEDGNVYEETRYTGVNSEHGATSSTGYRSNFMSIDLSKLHKDYDKRAADAGFALTIGSQYTFTYEFYLINGRAVPLSEMYNNTNADGIAMSELTFTYTGQSSDTGDSGTTDDGSSGETGNEGEGGA